MNDKEQVSTVHWDINVYSIFDSLEEEMVICGQREEEVSSIFM